MPTTPYGFADAVALARSTAGLSAADLAAACGVRVDEVTEWESGGPTPDVATLDRLEAALGLESGLLLYVQQWPLLLDGDDLGRISPAHLAGLCAAARQILDCAAFDHVPITATSRPSDEGPVSVAIGAAFTMPLELDSDLEIGEDGFRCTVHGHTIHIARA